MVQAMRAAAFERVKEVSDDEEQSIADPLQIVLGIAADINNPLDLRLGACALAIPVMYPKLSAAVVQQNHTVTRVEPGELLDRIATRITNQAPVIIEADPAEPADAPLEPAE